MASGSGTRNYEFGEIRVIKPRAGNPHRATLVWLHGLGENMSSWIHDLKNLQGQFPNIKFICLTAPTRFVTILGSSENAWFDLKDIDEDEPVDFEVLDNMAAAVANVLHQEPDDVKLCVGGFGMGATAAFYCAACYGIGEYSNGSSYTGRLWAVVGISGWLPGIKVMEKKLQESSESIDRLRSLQVLISHGRDNEYVPSEHGERASHVLSLNGFHRHMEYRGYPLVDHLGSRGILSDVVRWLNTRI